MRLVAHTCSNTEIVCALGRGDWLVGVDEHSDHPPEVVGALPRIGPDLDVDVEKIRALEPDLVITSLTVPGHEKCLEKMQAANFPLLVTQPHGLADVAADIRRIGQAIDAAAAAERLAGRFDAELEQTPASDENLLSVLVEWWPKPVIVPGRDSWVNEMLRLAGARNPWENEPAESLIVQADDALRKGPQAVIMSWCGVSEDKYHAHVVRRREGWQQVPAIAGNRIFPLSEQWLARPGPRLLDGMEKLRRLVARCQSGTTE
ncbi:MAG TPA: cobalamin-binding protein [Wenzhouxiangella sp.]|nr:cobalamin-binding protein [Wenzhouxiangella sp.]